MIVSGKIALDEFLQMVRQSLPRPPVEIVRVRDAVGRVAAQTIQAPAAVPLHNTALRAGAAVVARDTVGASMQSPAFLPATPVAVVIGDSLPHGCDAVADLECIITDNTFPEIVEPVAPGEGVRLAGHDLRQGHRLVQQGARITPAIALACALAGLMDIPVFDLRIFVADHGDPARHWLSQTLAALGVSVANDPHGAVMHINWDSALQPSLAMAPGGAIAFKPDHHSVTLDCPPRFDSVVALYCAILVPCLASMTGCSIVTFESSVARKISSAIGMSDIVLLKHVPQGVLPLSVGDVTLDALMQADAFSIMPPQSEGMQANMPLAITPLHAPFAPVPIQ